MNTKKLKFIFPICLIVFIMVYGIVYISNGNETASTDAKSIEVVNISGDYPSYPDLESLVSSSDAIIIGKVKKVNSPNIIDYKVVIDPSLPEETKNTLKNMQLPYYVYTVSDVEIEKVIKGDLKVGDNIAIKQMGGTFENKKYVTEDVRFFNNGSKRVIFLKDFRKDFGEDMPFSTLNPIQGDMEIVDGKLRPNGNSKIFKYNMLLEDFIKSIN